MEVRTGVAHGEATSADEPPSKNVRKSELALSFVLVFAFASQITGFDFL